MLHMFTQFLFAQKNHTSFSFDNQINLEIFTVKVQTSASVNMGASNSITLHFGTDFILTGFYLLNALNLRIDEEIGQFSLIYTNIDIYCSQMRYCGAFATFLLTRDDSIYFRSLFFLGVTDRVSDVVINTHVTGFRISIF